MGMNTYAGLVVHISQDQIMGMNATIRTAYSELLRSFVTVVVDNEDEIEEENKEEVDLDCLAEVLRDGYEGELDEFREEHPDIYKAYENFVEVFKSETGVGIDLFDLQSDMECAGELQEGANWTLHFSDCFQHSPAFETLQKAHGSCYMEFFTIYG